MATRAFDANAARLLRRATVVYSVDDIRRNITERLADGAPCVLEMGANIPIETMTLPGGLRSFSIDGAGRWSFIVRGDQSSVFRVLGRDDDNGYSTTFANLSVKMKSGSTATVLFRVEQMPLSAYTEKYTALNMRNVNVEGLDGTAYTVGSVFGVADVAGFRFGILNVDGMTVRGATYLFEPADTQALWSNCSIKNLSIGANVDAFASSIGAGIAGCGFGDCIFQGISGKFVVDTGLLSDNVLWSVLRSSAFPCTFITNNVGPTSSQTLLRVDGFTRSLSVGDIDLDNISGGGGGISDGNKGDVTVTSGGTVWTVTRPQVKATTITVPFGLQEQTVTVVDASCTATSKVIVGWGSTAPTDENQPGACAVTFSAVPAAGSLDITVSSDNADPVGGTYKILYTLG